MKGYYRLISGIDSAIGSLRETLAQRGLADNTIIIYSADHGIFNGEKHGLAANRGMRTKEVDSWPAHRLRSAPAPAATTGPCAASDDAQHRSLPDAVRDGWTYTAS